MIRLGLVWLVVVTSARPGFPQGSEIPVGRSTVQLSERHPSSEWDTQSKRFGWQRATLFKEDPAKGDYDLAEESYEVMRPPAREDGREPGLFVWIQPHDSGRLPPDWYAVLMRHHLVAVAANDSGNDRRIPYRIALALDAVQSIQQAIPTDPHRIYVAGFSGGGRIASRLGFHYPEVFTGSIYVGGCSFYQPIKNPAKPQSVWPATFPKPTSSRWNFTKDKHRHVFLIGSEDFNLVQSRGIFDWMTKKDRYQRVEFLEIPDLDHTWPPGDWLERAVVALDRLGEDG